VPIIVASSPSAIPLWQGWAIGLSPLLGLAWFSWWNWRRYASRPAVHGGNRLFASDPDARVKAGSWSSEAYYDSWFELYHVLSTLPLDRPEVRRSPEVIRRLRTAGYEGSPQTLEQYWHRVDWTARQCRGRVLEIGAGMGNITRWIVANPAVSGVLALETLPRYVRALEDLRLPRTTALQIDVRTGLAAIRDHAPFDTVVLAEFVEHITARQEVALLREIRPYLSPEARWVVTTPIGFMPDPDHRRGFSRPLFRVRSALLYGPVDTRGDNRIQQFCLCPEQHRSPYATAWRDALARALDWIFDARSPNRGRPLVRTLLTRLWRIAQRLYRAVSARP
jgi:2-polyprenyl-3-methyl-5-hydroxy-6-metoxy-1,4-benzoquinol methylase